MTVDAPQRDVHVRTSCDKAAQTRQMRSPIRYDLRHHPSRIVHLHHCIAARDWHALYQACGAGGDGDGRVVVEGCCPAVAARLATTIASAARSQGYVCVLKHRQPWSDHTCTSGRVGSILDEGGERGHHLALRRLAGARAGGITSPVARAYRTNIGARRLSEHLLVTACLARRRVEGTAAARAAVDSVLTHVW